MKDRFEKETDDWESGDYEEFYGDPGDREEENNYWAGIHACEQEENQDEVFESDSITDNDCDDWAYYEAERECYERKEEIVTWLEKSPYAHMLAHNAGFFVFSHYFVRLQDNTIMRISEWLKAEEIIHMDTIGPFIISYPKINNENTGKIFFFKLLIDAPFDSPIIGSSQPIEENRDWVDDEDSSDDIPI